MMTMMISMMMIVMMTMMMSLMAQMWSNWRPRQREPAGNETEELKELLLGFLTNNNSGNEVIIHAFSDWMSPNSNSEVETLSFSMLAKEMLPQKVLSIVGPGATTLAEKLYNDTEGHFVCRAKVKLSQNSGSMAVLTSILRQVSSSDDWNPGDNDGDHLYKLIDRISKALMFKRYLIVILDIWEESEWESIERAFPIEFSCSGRVITTTRRSTVAETCFAGKFDLVYKLELPPHEEEDARQETAAAMRASAKPRELADAFLKSPHSSTIPWEDCMLYLSMLQDDQEFERDSLISKWLAEKFMADVTLGNIYFDELVNRNVILQHPDGQPRCMFGEEPTYHVRPTLLRALRKKSQEKGFVRFISNGQAAASSSDTSPRRLSVIPEGQLPTQVLAPSAAAEPAVESSPAPAAPPCPKEALDLCSATSVIARGHIQGLILPLMHMEKHEMRVLDLEGCQDVENADVVAICCHLTLLRYLSLKGTLVDVIPEDVKNLRNLETLDVRKTPLKQLPDEVALLPNLERLLFSEGVKFLVQGAPLNQSSSSIKVLGPIELSELQKPSMVDYAKNVRELTVVCNGEGLLNEWPAVSLRCLEKLKVSGRCVKLPAWIKQQHELSKVTILNIRVCQLEDLMADLEALGKMVSLQSLALTLVSLPTKPIVIRSTSRCNKEPLFSKLVIFALDCRVPWVAFKKKAMPALRCLYLKLYAGSSNKTPSGIVYLKNLREVTLHFSPCYAGSASVTHNVAAMEHELAHHTGKVAVALFFDKHKHHKIPKVHTLSSTSNIVQWFMRNLFECVVMPFFYQLYWVYKRSGSNIIRNFMYYLLAIPLFSFAFPRLLSYFLLPRITNWVAHEIARRAFDSSAITLPFPLLFYALHGNIKWLLVLRFSIFILLDTCSFKLFTRAFPKMLPLFITLQHNFFQTGKIDWQLVLVMFAITLIIHRLL